VTTLKDVYKFKKDIQELELSIKAKMEEYGINEDLVTVEAMKEDYKCMVGGLVEQGVLREDNYAIVDNGRKKNVVNIERLKNREEDYNNLKEYFVLPVGIATKYFKDKTVMEELCDTTVNHNYDIIDVIEGE
jgi:hypothetical protein